TFTDSEQKRRAQRMSAQEAGGPFTRRYEVYPMYKEDIGNPDRRIGRDQRGTKAWYPEALAEQIAYWVADREEYPSAAQNLLPFDGTDTFEKELTRIALP
ncbi:MAG: hypothetical protein ACOC0A_03340, partial [Planctomycetota bacterium]